jgi:AcrR family transcriptional regulator
VIYRPFNHCEIGGLCYNKGQNMRKNTAIRQKEIISAARKLIVKYGSENVTVRKMAEETGVSEGDIYKHFKSKRDILSFLIDDIKETLLKDLNPDNGAPPASFADIEALFIEHISGIKQRKGVNFQVIAEIISLGDRRLNRQIYDTINSYTGHIGEIISRGIESGIFKAEISPETSARMYYSLIQGLVNLWALSQYKLDLIKEYKIMLALFFEPLLKP